MSPRAWFTTVSMCFSKVNSVSTYTPRPFSLVVVASVVAPMVYSFGVGFDDRGAMFLYSLASSAKR